MLDRAKAPEPADPITALAILYFHDALDGPRAAAFERWLAEDQTAREALGEAVRLCGLSASPALILPDPSYRDRVRARLHPPAPHTTVRWAQRAWVGFAAAVTVLVLASLGTLFISGPIAGPTAFEGPGLPASAPQAGGIRARGPAWHAVSLPQPCCRRKAHSQPDLFPGRRMGNPPQLPSGATP